MRWRQADPLLKDVLTSPVSEFWVGGIGEIAPLHFNSPKLRNDRWNRDSNDRISAYIRTIHPDRHATLTFGGYPGESA
jgi:hypothetical protein